MFIGNFTMHRLALGIELAADDIDGHLAVLQFVNYRQRVSDHFDLFVLNKLAKPVNSTAAVHKNDISINNLMGCHTTYLILSFYIFGCFVDELVRNLMRVYFHSAAVRTIK